MFKTNVHLSLSLVLFATLAACGLDDTSSANRAIIQTPCADDTECPAGFECEIEVEHGVTTSFCQAHEESDGTCPPGYESEIEHGQLFCKPHGGDDDDGGADDDGGTGTGTGTDGATCTSDSDCAAGLECEIEVEHGQTFSSCQPHGGA